MLALLAANGLRSLWSKIRKRQIVRNANADLWPDFGYHPLNLNATFRTRSMNSCYRPTKLPLPKFHSNIFTEPPKYVKLHVMAENSENRPEITEPCSRCSLPTGSKASDQESENVKSCGMHMPTYHPIFVIIRWIKTQLFAQGTWTCVIPLRSHINLIVGPTGPNNQSRSPLCILSNLISRYVSHFKEKLYPRASSFN